MGGGLVGEGAAVAPPVAFRGRQRVVERRPRRRTDTVGPPRGGGGGGGGGGGFEGVRDSQ